MQITGLSDPGGNLFATAVLGSNNHTQAHGGKEPHFCRPARKPGNVSLYFIFLKRHGAAFLTHHVPLAHHQSRHTRQLLGSDRSWRISVTSLKTQVGLKQGKPRPRCKGP